jgi:hypothetical protein
MLIIPKELIDYFGGSNAPVFWLVPQLLDSGDRLGSALQRLSKELETAPPVYDGQPPIWMSQIPCQEGPDRNMQMLIQVIEDAVAAERLRIITSVVEVKRPYDHLDLVGLNPDSDGLVRFVEFNSGVHFFPGLNRGNTVFEVLPSLPRAVNSMYWVLKELVPLVRKVDVRIRLDPLLVHDVTNYAPVLFRMLVWGRPLDCDRLANLKQEEHCRWIPDNGWQPDVEFTDLVWTPRDDGLHFLCEEVPKTTACSFRPSRYFHSIFDPKMRVFIHCDGASRVYNREELVIRHQIHVRQTGKVGKRVKVFAVDGQITSEEWTNLTCAYFVWNMDLQRYFGNAL